MVGPVVFCILLYAISHQIRRQPGWEHSLQRIGQVLGGAGILKLLLVFGLLFLNWGLEARKWQLALRPLGRVSLALSYRAIFSGATMAFFTPNRMGEYLGRMLYLEPGKRWSSISLTVVCSIAQLLTTLVVGATGLIFLRPVIAGAWEGSNIDIIFWINLLIAVVFAVATVLTIFYFRLSSLVRWAGAWRWMRKWVVYLRPLQAFNATILLRILSLSVSRYLVFVTQYYLLFEVFEVEMGWWQSFWSVSVIFLTIALIPSMAMLTELGIRWGASVEVLRLFSPNIVGIFASSLSAWVINLVIPALIGSLLILGLKIFRDT